MARVSRMARRPPPSAWGTILGWVVLTASVPSVASARVPGTGARAAQANPPTKTAPQAAGVRETSDPQARARVRGDRAEHTTLRSPWIPPASIPDAAERAELARFEDRELGPAAVPANSPDPWMKQLVHPDLPIRFEQGLVEYLRYFVQDERGKAMMTAWLRRAGRYEALLRRILAEHGVPEDLLWVVLAESGFNPRARSAVGAAGPWQFMESTATVYGLRRSYWVDERYDLERSTRAAALYLGDLKVRFGSWELALAAYNAGYGLVLTAIERHNTNHFWRLAQIEGGLPHATVHYVPKVLAAALIGRNRQALGFGPDRVGPLAPVVIAEVEVPHSTRLASIARALDEDVELIEELNAALIRRRTPPGQPWRVKVPKAKAARLQGALSSFTAQWGTQATYAVREGERLDQIAAAHGISERQLRADNGIRDAAEVRRGVTLIVPTRLVGQLPPASTPEPTLAPLAAVPALQPGPQTRRVFVQATRATTIETLQASLGVTWADLVAWNDLDPLARLQPGQVLQALVPRTFDPAAGQVVIWEADEVELCVRGSVAHLEASLARRGKQRRAVVAKRGDTLARIGRRFGLTAGDLARINMIPRDHPVAPGDAIIVYVELGATRGTLPAPTSPVGPITRNRRSTP